MEAKALPTLAYELNEYFQDRYEKLFDLLGFSRPEMNAAHGNRPGYEFVELLLLLDKKEGNAGLHRFYEHLKNLGENASVAIIHKSPIVGRFTDQPFVSPQIDSTPASANVQPAKKTQYVEFPRKTEVLIDPTDQLNSIHDKLESNELVAIHGLSGLGKTTLATEYGRRFGLQYDLVVWIKCNNVESIVFSFRELASTLNAKITDEEWQNPCTIEQLVSKPYFRLVKQQLQRKHCLIVYDNCNDWGLTKMIYDQLHPTDMSGRAILTTQRPASEWSTSEIPVASYPILPYSESSTVDYMLKLVYPHSKPQYDEYNHAAEIYSIYSGAPIFMSLIAKYAHQQKMKLHDYLQKFRSHLINNPAIQVKEASLLMIFNELDDVQMFVMQLLAIRPVNIEYLCDMNFIVPYNSKTKEADLKAKLAPLIDLSLIIIHSTGRINIGHDVLKTYVINTILPERIEYLLDKCYEESYSSTSVFSCNPAQAITSTPNIWLSLLTNSRISLDLLSFYVHHVSVDRALCKIIEVLGLKLEGSDIKPLFDRKLAEKARYYPHHCLLLELLMSPESRKDSNQLLEAVKYFTDSLGENHLVTTIAKFFFFQMGPQPEYSQWISELKGLQHTSAKVQKFQIKTHIKMARLYKVNKQYESAKNELIECWNLLQIIGNFRSESQFSNCTIVVRMCLDINLPQLAQSISIDLLTKIITPTASSFQCQLPMVAGLVVDCQQASKEPTPKLLYSPPAKHLTNTQALEMLIEKRDRNRQDFRFHINVPDWHVTITNWHTSDHFCTLCVDNHEIVIWNPEKDSTKDDGRCTYYIACLEAVKPDFLLKTVHSNILFSVSIHLSFVISDKILAKLFEEHGYTVLVDHQEESSLELPIDEFDKDTQMIYNMMAQLAAQNVTIQQFMSVLKTSTLNDNDMQITQDRLFSANIPVLARRKTFGYLPQLF